MPQTVSASAAARCSECGRTFSTDNMIRHQNLFICQACKPVFMQKLAEGAMIHTGELRYAGFWIRFASAFVDGIIQMALYIPLLIMMGQTPAQMVGLEQRPLSMLGVAQLLSLAIAVTYETILVGRYGATFGKMACGIRVVTPDGDNVTYMRAFGRYFGKMLSYLTIYIGFIIAGFDAEKRALHDRVCNTRVVYK